METSFRIVNADSSMLKYCKLILDRMSFDRKLLRKEYRKSLRWLTNEERLKLNEWMRIRFRGQVMHTSNLSK
ncbi:hypothetical protein BH09BAC3_BH09BAC3_23810 [soil metagenome]